MNNWYTLREHVLILRWMGRSFLKEFRRKAGIWNYSKDMTGKYVQLLLGSYQPSFISRDGVTLFGHPASFRSLEAFILKQYRRFTLSTLYLKYFVFNILYFWSFYLKYMTFFSHFFLLKANSILNLQQYVRAQLSEITLPYPRSISSNS